MPVLPFVHSYRLLRDILIPPLDVSARLYPRICWLFRVTRNSPNIANSDNSGYPPLRTQCLDSTLRDSPPLGGLFIFIGCYAIIKETSEGPERIRSGPSGVFSIFFPGAIGEG